jgi:TolA-binding protein
VVVLAGLLLGSWLANSSVWAQAESTPDAKIAYGDAANFQNNGAYDLAIQDWLKFLKNYPQDPLAAKAQHYLGICYVQAKKYPEAIAAFELVQKNFPKFELLEDTLLQLGWSRYTLAAGDAKQFPLAADTFTLLLNQYPKGKHADQACYFLGESNYQQGKRPEAIAAYDRLIKEHPQSKLRVDGLYAMGVAQEEIEKYADAGATYDLFIKEFAQNELITEVKMRKAETVLQAGDFATAAKSFGEVAAVANFALADHAMYRQAFCLTKLNQFVEAAALYGKITETYPKSERVNISDATLSAGRCYYRGEKLAEAATWFNKSLALVDNNSFEAAHWLCRINLREKKYAPAAELAARYIPSAVKNDFLVPLMVDQADALYEITERRAEAIPLYVKIATDHPQHALASQSLYNAAFTALELKKFDEGQKYATDFLKAYPQDKLLPDVKYVSAECHLQQNKPAEAEAVYKELTGSAAEHAEIQVWRIRYALALYLQKKYNETVALLTPLVAQFKVPEQLAEVQYLIGSSQFYSEKYAEAEQALNAALAAAPKWRQADETMLTLSRTQRKLNKNNEAITTAIKLITDFTESKLLDQARYRLGEYRYATDDFKNAVTEYDVVITHYSTSTFVPFALYGKGWSHLKLKEFAPATQAFTTLLEKHPQHSLINETRFARALSRRQEGNFQGAAEDAEAFVATNPQGDAKADALYERGLAEVGLNKLDAAIATFEGIIKDFPKFAGLDKTLYELGWAYKTHMKAEASLAAFARLANDFSASPLAAEAYFHVAEDQYNKKQYAEAAKTYTFAKQKSTAGELGEKSTYKLGWANFQLKQYDPAFKEFAEQLEKYPQGPLANDATFMKAESLFKQAKYQEALPIFQAALKVKASTPAMEVLTFLHGGQTASQLKQYDLAVQMLSEISTKFPDSPYVPEAFYELGFAKHKSGKAEDAMKDYTVAAEKSRTEVGARARFMLGEVLFEQKKFPEAIAEFQRGMYSYGGDNATAEVKPWQANCGYEAGRCSEVQIAEAKDATAKAKLIADAVKFYEFVTQKHAESSVAPQAKQRIEALGKLK